jgi:hypothetical protein
MRKDNESGLYPSVILHRSHFGQLAIGGAMINRVYEDENTAEYDQARPGDGGWRTRFDRRTDGRHSELPCHLVAMYVEGRQHFRNQSEGEMGFVSCDVEIETRPSCYAVAVFRVPEQTNVDGKIVNDFGEHYVYLRSNFSFSHRVRHDGFYDLKEAFDVARNRKGHNDEEWPFWETHGNEWQGDRNWHLVPKTHVPGRIRQILHKTVAEVDVTITDNFGQGKEFFKLWNRNKKK